MDVVAALEVQAQSCAELGSPMYAALLERCAADARAGGVVAEVLAGHEDDPEPSALALRLMGSVHRLVLERRAGALAASYPSVGGTFVADVAWPAFLALLAEQPEEVRSWLDRPPQTNEVGRASALYGGLLQLSDGLSDPLSDPLPDPLRLFEIGSSAGLNLLADAFTYVDESGATFGSGSGSGSGSASGSGSGSGSVVLDPAWRGRPLRDRPVRVVERGGCDLWPVDAASTEGRLALTAYVWADQAARFERLRGALALAAAQPPPVRREGAVSFVESLGLAEATTTVLWHSVMWQYLPTADAERVSARIEELGRLATPTRAFAHLRAEPMRRSEDGEREFQVWLRSWPGGEDRLLGTTVAHGLPTTWA